MNISMEKFNLKKHGPHLVATLIYAADREFNEIVCGSEAAGVLVGFTGREKQQLDQGSGKAFARVFGFWSFPFI